MTKKIRDLCGVGLAVLGLFAPLALAESSPKMLIPKVKAVQPKIQPKIRPKINLLRPEGLDDFPIELPLRFNTFNSISFSLLIGTPLIYESFYETRFGSFGDFFLFSIPLLTLNKNTFFHLETGPGFTFTRLTFENPPQKYTHLYLVAPIRFRFIYSLSRNFHFEAFAGVVLRPIEYDSRSTSDGGTRRVKGAAFLSGDGGMGIDYYLTSPLKVRLLVGYLFLSAGLELTL
ncbi:MAG: hypothetical protein EXR74_03015 [Bdellovibrionales bacterium]|nr:hypothetical protein [Bdellovibrionales bacterium]